MLEVVEDKVKRAYDIMKSPVLVEDVSLIFVSMKALPGPLIKWFLESLGNEGLCKLFRENEKRDATAEVMFAFCDEEGVRVFSGKMDGSIAQIPKGEMGFGWGSIFILNGYSKTWAEMNDREKHETSMRKIALEKLTVFLEDYQK